MRLKISCWDLDSNPFLKKERFVVHLTHFFKKVYSICCVLGTVLNTGDAAMGKTDKLFALKNKFQIEDRARYEWKRILNCDNCYEGSKQDCVMENDGGESNLIKEGSWGRSYWSSGKQAGNRMVRRSPLCEDPGGESFWQRGQQIQGADKEWGALNTAFEEQRACQWDGCKELECGEGI